MPPTMPLEALCAATMPPQCRLEALYAANHAAYAANNAAYAANNAANNAARVLCGGIAPSSAVCCASLFSTTGWPHRHK